MRITFQQHNPTELLKERTMKSNTENNLTEGGAIAWTRDAGVYLGASPRDIGLCDMGKGKSLLELKQEAGNIDVGVMQDYMTLVSNTMSEEDYARLQEEGFDFGEMDPEEAVTIIDKIKTELLRSGVSVQGYTDDISQSVLAEILGSDSLAGELISRFSDVDLPLTEDNIKSIAIAHRLSEELKELNEGSVRYLIDNRLEPNLWTLYLAQNSGASGISGGEVSSYSEEQVKGYYVRNSVETRQTDLSEQIDRVLERSGYERDENSRNSANWLLEKNLPLTRETLDMLAEIRNIKLPLSDRDFAETVSKAIMEGKNPAHGRVEPGGENIYEKAVRIEKLYREEESFPVDLSEITARRQLEEIRLRMTAEVNLRLIKSGFAIETAPMEQLLEALRQAEKELADIYFRNDEAAVDKFRIYGQTERILRQLPQLPAATIGQVADRFDTVTTEELYIEGIHRKTAYDMAGERYETMMTTPSAGMGDSLKKAFGNIDRLLQDIGIEPNEENRRAVRILGYNHMTIDRDGIEKVMVADRQVQTVIDKLTPATTLKMIRDGVNPLERSFEELNDYLQGIEPDFSQETESYSRFLYNLERNGGITEEERQSFIGIYRMLRQIEKSDGAAIGGLVNTQAELQFSNLLHAVRSGKFRHMDIKVDQAFGGIEALIQTGKSISDQIAAGFAQAARQEMEQFVFSESASREYIKAQMNEHRTAVANAAKEVISLLERGELPANAENILAAEALLTEEAVLPSFERLSKRRERELEETEEESLGEAYESLLCEQREEIEAESLSGGQRSLDIRKLKLVHKQLTICSRLGERQEYYLSTQIGERTARVRLTILHAEKQAGSVSIAVNLPDAEALRAEFHLEKGVLNGKIEDTADKVMNCRQIADNFIEGAGEIWEIGDIIVGTSNAGIADFGRGMEAVTENQELYRVAKIFLAAVKNGEAYENQL